jgi:hypothetical protein
MEILPFMPQSISLKYTESFGIDIEIYIKDEMYSGKHHCNINIKNRDFIKREEEKSINIDYDFFKKLYQKFINLNFNSLIIESGIMGLDGSRLEISIAYGNSFSKISVWCYDYDIKKRSLEELNEIIDEMLKKCNLNKNWVEKYLKDI